jgi:hypothetical protein
MPENSICIVRSLRKFAGLHARVAGKPLIDKKSSLDIQLKICTCMYIDKPARTKHSHPPIGAEFDR